MKRIIFTIFLIISVIIYKNLQKQSDIAISQVDLNLEEEDFALTFLYDTKNKAILFNYDNNSCLYLFSDFR